MENEIHIRRITNAAIIIDKVQKALKPLGILVTTVEFRNYEKREGRSAPGLKIEITIPDGLLDEGLVL